MAEILPKDGKAGDSPAPIMVKLFGYELPVRPWTVNAISCVLLVTLVVCLTGKYVLPVVNDSWDRLAGKDIQHIEYHEYQRHASEHAVPIYSKQDLTVSLYPSDGCLLVARSAGPPQWVINLNRYHRQPAPGAVEDQAQLSPGTLPWEGTAMAQARPGRCLNPHPGEFSQSDGQRRGCWVQKIRVWRDGCRQYQWYDTCYQTWDLNRDGSPKVFWTACKH